MWNLVSTVLTHQGPEKKRKKDLTFPCHHSGPALCRQDPRGHPQEAPHGPDVPQAVWADAQGAAGQAVGHAGEELHLQREQSLHHCKAGSGGVLRGGCHHGQHTGAWEAKVKYQSDTVSVDVELHDAPFGKFVALCDRKMNVRRCDSGSNKIE